MTKFSRTALEKLENEELSCDELLQEKLCSLNPLEMTATELFAEAEQGGWDEWLYDLTLAELDRILDLPPPRKKRPVKTGPKPRKTVPVREASKDRSDSKPDKRPCESTQNRIHRKILSFLRDNPWSITTNIVRALALPDPDAQDALAILIKKDWLKTVGSGANTRYALA